MTDYRSEYAVLVLIILLVTVSSVSALKVMEPVQITSIELDLPDNIEFVDVDPEGYIDQGPGMSRGIYMWVSDDYIIDPDSEINLIVYLQGISPGKNIIEFKITTHDVFIEADGIEIEIK